MTTEHENTRKAEFFFHHLVRPPSENSTGGFGNCSFSAVSSHCLLVGFAHTCTRTCGTIWQPFYAAPPNLEAGNHNKTVYVHICSPWCDYQLGIQNPILCAYSTMLVSVCAQLCMCMCVCVCRCIYIWGSLHVWASRCLHLDAMCPRKFHVVTVLEGHPGANSSFEHKRA